MVNMQLGLFNLIPGFPLDGGRVLRAGLWARNKDFDRATSQAALVGIGFGVALGLIGAVLMAGAWSGVLGQYRRDERGLAHLYRRIPLFGGIGKQTAGSPADVVGVGDGSSGHGPPRRDPTAGYERARRGRSILCRARTWRIPRMRRGAGSWGGHCARRASASRSALAVAPCSRDHAPGIAGLLYFSGLVHHAGDGPHGPGRVGSSSW